MDSNLKEPMDYYSRDSMENFLKKANQLVEEKKYDLAEEYYRRSYRLLNFIFNNNIKVYWYQRQRLSELLVEKKQYQEAKELYAEGIQYLGHNDLSFFRFYYSLSRIAYYEGNIEEMNAYNLMFYYSIVELFYKEDLFPDTSSLFFRMKGRYLETPNFLETLLKVRELYRKRLGEDSLEYYSINIRIGSIYDDLSQAKPYFEESLKINDRLYGKCNQENNQLMGRINKEYSSVFRKYKEDDLLQYYKDFQKEYLEYVKSTYGYPSEEYGKACLDSTYLNYSADFEEGYNNLTIPPKEECLGLAVDNYHDLYGKEVKACYQRIFNEFLLADREYKLTKSGQRKIIELIIERQMEYIPQTADLQDIDFIIMAVDIALKANSTSQALKLIQRIPDYSILNREYQFKVNHVLAKYYLTNGGLKQAEKYIKKCIAYIYKYIGKEDAGLIGYYYDLGTVYETYEKKYKEALNNDYKVLENLEDDKQAEILYERIVYITLMYKTYLAQAKEFYTKYYQLGKMQDDDQLKKSCVDTLACFYEYNLKEDIPEWLKKEKETLMQNNKVTDELPKEEEQNENLEITQEELDSVDVELVDYQYQIDDDE